LVERLTRPEQAVAVKAYCEQASRKSDLDRTDLAKEKTGVFHGFHSQRTRANNRPVPIWVADYVPGQLRYPARSWPSLRTTRATSNFAQQFQIPIVAVVDPGHPRTEVNRDDVLAGKIPFTEHGTSINSSQYNGLATAEFKEKISADLSKAGPRSSGREL